MGSRRARVLLLLATLALLALAFLPAGTAAATDPCAGIADDPTIVATPPSDAPTGPNDTVAVYRGSGLVVHLCQPGNETRTLDADSDWATTLESSPERVHLRVEAAPEASLGEMAGPGTVPGPALVVVDRSVDSELVNGSIPVPSADRGASLLDAEATYLERERAYERQLAALANATDAVEDGHQPGGDPISSTLDERRAYRNASQALQAELYAVADSEVGGPRSGVAIRELGERSTALENRTERRLGEYDDALRDREESLTWALRFRILGLGLLGVLLGGAAGAILPTRRGRAARRRLARGEWTTYSRRSLYLPAAIGLVLCCVAGGWLALQFGSQIAGVLGP